MPGAREPLTSEVIDRRLRALSELFAFWRELRTARPACQESQAHQRAGGVRDAPVTDRQREAPRT